MYSPAIESLRNEYNELVEFCRSKNETSFETYIQGTYSKVLLLSAASYFETEITKAIRDFVKDKTHGNQEIVNLVENKVLSRQYHTFFDWKANNANQFFALFGDEFKSRAKEEIQTKELGDAEVAFMSIGQERNLIVHKNYIETQTNGTFNDIYTKYEKACDFVDLITRLLSG